MNIYGTLIVDMDYDTRQFRHLKETHTQVGDTLDNLFTIALLCCIVWKLGVDVDDYTSKYGQNKNQYRNVHLYL